MDLRVKNFSGSTLAGQKIITGIYGTTLNSETKDYLLRIKPGGIILFSRNIENKGQLKKLNNDIFKFFEENSIPRPFLAIDQEGGSVARLKEPEFRELKALSTISDIHEAEKHAYLMCEILKELGFNMNMAPVLDIASLLEISIMDSRSFPGSARDIAKLGTAMAKEYMKNNIIPVGKHFPGIGGTSLDSHLCLPVYDKDYGFMKENDLFPFKEAIENNLPAIMFSHILYSSIDEKWPASLSPAICRDILRGDMNFTGVTMTDDLDMKAITCGIETAAKQIADSDQDIALICHSLEDADTIHQYFTALINEDGKDLLNSVQRIFKLKNRFL